RRIEGVQPRGDGTRMLIAGVPTRDFVAVASSPDDIRVGRIRHREAGFAATHAVVPSGLLVVDRHARTPHVPIVLHVAVDVVGNLIVHINVVHLTDGKIYAVESAPVKGRDVQS